MALPKIKHLVVKDKIPSTGEEISMRAFTVKEEKILLFGISSQDSDAIVDAMYQVIKNCVVLPRKFDPTKYALFDIGYIFLKLRALSVSNIVEIQYKDPDDDKFYEVDIDLNKVIVKFPEDHTNKISLLDDIGAVMKYPDLKTMNTLKAVVDDPEKLVEALYSIMASLIDKVWNGDEVSVAGTDFTQEEITEWLDNLPDDAFRKIENFFATMPTLYYEAKYMNVKGESKTVVFTELSNFLH